jgi:hypothetical protein
LIQGFTYLKAWNDRQIGKYCLTYEHTNLGEEDWEEFNPVRFAPTELRSLRDKQGINIESINIASAISLNRLIGFEENGVNTVEAMREAWLSNKILYTLLVGFRFPGYAEALKNKANAVRYSNRDIKARQRLSHVREYMSSYGTPEEQIADANETLKLVFGSKKVLHDLSFMNDAKHGITVIDGMVESEDEELFGLKGRLKGDAAIAEKIERKIKGGQATVRDDIADYVLDLIGYTVIISNTSDTELLKVSKISLDDLTNPKNDNQAEASRKEIERLRKKMDDKRLLKQFVKCVLRAERAGLVTEISTSGNKKWKKRVRKKLWVASEKSGLNLFQHWNAENEDINEDFQVIKICLKTLEKREPLEIQFTTPSRRDNDTVGKTSHLTKGSSGLTAGMTKKERKELRAANGRITREWEQISHNGFGSQITPESEERGKALRDRLRQIPKESLDLTKLEKTKPRERHAGRKAVGSTCQVK